MGRALVLLVAGSLAVAAGAGAATVKLHPNGRIVVLEGRIELGDLDKVARISEDAAPTAIYLASPGGNLGEAMRIGALVRRLAWETKTADGPNLPAAIRSGVAASYGIRNPARNNVCASACFFIFVSGIYRDGHVLGIHQPYMSLAEMEKISAEEASRRTSDVKATVDRFLKRMGVPPAYLEEMYEVPKEKVRWLTEDEIRADFQGFIPEVREWVQTQCGEDAATVRCKNDVMTGIRIRALQQGIR